MIDKSFWMKIADNWKKKSDGIISPDTESDGFEAGRIDPEEIPFDEISDEEIDDILVDLGLDDI